MTTTTIEDKLSAEPGDPLATKIDTPPAPPKRGPGRPPKAPEDRAPQQSGAAKKKARDEKLKGQLVEFVTTIGLVVSIKSPADGNLIIARADPLSAAWCDLAATNPKVRKALEAVVNGSALSAVVMQTGILAIGIAGNHGVLPPAIAGLAQMASAAP